MSSKPLDKSKADRLLSDLNSDPETFKMKGLSNELLEQFFRGYSLDNLRSLLRHNDDRVLSVGMWIASELPSEASALLDDVIAISKHSDPYIRFYALDVILLGTRAARREDFIHVVKGIEDPNGAVSTHALSFLSRADNDQLIGAITHLEREKPDSPHLPELHALVEARSVKEDDVERMILGDDALRRKYGVAIADRINDLYPNLIRVACNSDDELVRSVAKRMSERRGLNQGE